MLRSLCGVIFFSGVTSFAYFFTRFSTLRTAMRRFKIADLRLIFENDVRFLEQF